MSQNRWHPRRSRLGCETSADQRRRPARNTTDFEEITSVENLVAAFCSVRDFGGAAVGPDRIRKDDIAMGDVWDLARSVSKSLGDHSYRPGDTRWIRILKQSSESHAYRRIQIPRLVDRIVSCAMQQALGPIIDDQLLGGCYSQSGRGPLSLLAHIDHDIRRTGFAWVVNEDVTGAFDHIPKQYVVDCHRALISDSRLLQLLERVVQGYEANTQKGLAQGGATSPCLYTRTMHVLHDLAMQRSQTPHWYRYVDNHIYLSQDEATARSNRRHAQEILGAQGLTLKFKEAEAIVNLRERDTELLGFRISVQAEGLHLNVDDKAWRDLEDKLDQSHADSRPVTLARKICNGWANAYGPGIVDPDDTTRRMTSLTQDLNLGGSVSRSELTDAITKGKSKWELIRQMEPISCSERIHDDAGCLRRPQRRAEVARHSQTVRVYLPPGAIPADVPFDACADGQCHAGLD